MNPVKLGEWLAELRRAKGWSLEELSAKTKINPRFLDALERGDLDSLPTRVHARAFALAYARACGADEEEATDKVRQGTAPYPLAAASSLKPTQPLPAPSAPGKGTGGSDAASKSTKWMGIAAAAAAALGVWALQWAFGPRAEVRNPSPLPAAEPQPQVSPAPAPAEGEELSLRSRRPCWVVLQIDGQRLPTIILERDKKETWRVRHKAVLLASNIGAVRVWWRGENLGYLGELGQRMNGVVFEPGRPWRRDPAEELPLPPGVPASPPFSTQP